MLKPRLIFEDDKLLVFDKPAGLVMHRGNATGSQPTLVDLLKDKIKDSDTIRPGIVHRIDKDTSGVVVVAKDQATKNFLQAQFKQRQVDKHYLTAVKGRLKKPRARIDVPIGRHPKNPLKRSVRAAGKPAVTEYQMLEERSGNSLLKINLKTGRTHQIRVHLSYLGHPVLGDKLYGSVHPDLKRQFLHAQSLSFTHPKGQRLTFTAELPQDLADFWYNQA